MPQPDNHLPQVRQQYETLPRAVPRGWQGKAAALDDAALFADFQPVYEVLIAPERLLLRHPQSGACAAG